MDEDPTPRRYFQICLTGQFFFFFFLFRYFFVFVCLLVYRCRIGLKFALACVGKNLDKPSIEYPGSSLYPIFESRYHITIPLECSLQLVACSFSERNIVSCLIKLARPRASIQACGCALASSLFIIHHAPLTDLPPLSLIIIIIQTNRWGH
jgi:hypothetical protein